ncbi:MAG TPA: hypothetical protein VGJ03_15160 [Acidimicrobiales bacterium]|jgi:alkylhydroperoxidase family enzyme
MDGRGSFDRRTLTPTVTAPWLAELVRTLPGLVGSYGRRGPLDPRTRERIILAVTEVNGCRYSAWIHSAWHEFLGELDDIEGTDAMLAYGRACAEAGTPVSSDALRDVLPAATVQSVRATVAQTELSNLAGSTVDGLVERLTGKRPFSPVAILHEATMVTVALPLAVPMVATAAVMRLTSRWAPRMPEVELPAGGDANLLTHLLASAAPTYLAHAMSRLVVLGMPNPVAFGVRAGRTTATVRIGRRAVVIENGISSDVVAVIDGEVEPLLELASGSIVRELGAIRLRER